MRSEFPTTPRKGEPGFAPNFAQPPFKRRAQAYHDWETRRVLISTTFADMVAERSYLVESVFPKLRERLAKFRVYLDEIDLRWGITAQQAEANETLAACLKQIDHSHIVLGIVGDRRGSYPKMLPPQVKSIRSLRGVPKPSFTEIELHYSHERKVPTVLLQRHIENLRQIPEEFRYFGSGDRASDEILRLPPGDHGGLAYNLRFTSFRVQRSIPERLAELVSLTSGESLTISGFRAFTPELRQELAPYLRPEFAGLDRFGELVFESLWQSLKLTLQLVPPEVLWQSLRLALQPVPPGAAHEIIDNEMHLRKVSRHTKVYTPWPTAVRWMDEFFEAPADRLALLIGPPGSGKSALLAGLAARVAKTIYMRSFIFIVRWSVLKRPR
jgi:hypothetical protein